ncbi:MAG: CdaR family protein [Clostridia bacterium]|nr:CdaR family protein [Clostridia bacterium]
MKKVLDSKIVLQILSAGVAVVLWFIIAYTVNPVISVTLKNIPVEYVNVKSLEDKELTPIYSNKIPVVSVVLEGTRNDLFNVMKKIHARIDLSSIEEEGVYDVPITVDIPINSVKLTKKKTDNLTITIEPLVKKDVPVVVKQTGTNKEYLIKSVSEEDTIAVSGAKSFVENIDYAQVTVDVSQIKENEISGYSYSFIDKNNYEIESTRNIKAQTSGGIVVSNTVYLAKTLPVEIEYPDFLTKDYIIDLKSITPQSVNIGILEDKYDEVTKLTALFPSHTAPADGVELSLPLVIPDCAYSKDVSSVTVKADIKRKETRILTIPIAFKNTPSNMTVVSSVRQIDIMVTGDGEKLNPSFITAAADLSNLDKGTHEVVLDITTPGNVSLHEQYKIMVTLQ